MQTQTDPGEVGSESLASAIADELARMRFVIAEMKGQSSGTNPYWYPTAVVAIDALHWRVFS